MAEKKTKKSRGHYSDGDIRNARSLWATGRFSSDDELAEYLDMPRSQTIQEWRVEHRPDGIPWSEVRDDLSRRVSDEMTAQLGQTVAEMNIEFVKVGRAQLQVGVQALRGGPFFVDVRELGFDADEDVAMREVAQVYGRDGRAVALSHVWPQTTKDAIALMAEGMKQQRLGRGEASERVAVYSQVESDMLDLLRRAWDSVEWPVERDDLHRALAKVFSDTADMEAALDGVEEVEV